MRTWEKLPESMRTEEVRLYYEYLAKHRGGLFVKRVSDVFLSCLLLILLSPFLVLIGILVGVTSRGGVFFCQERVTTYGRHFKIIKFRTMVADAEQKGSQVTTEGDSRVTGVGKILRRVRLDELPQLINIIKGDMSLVGTRPEVPRYVAQYTPEMMATLLLPAGVTSKASIAYKDEDRLLAAGSDVDKIYVEQVLPEKMRYNLQYLMEFSPGKDLQLMVQTVLAVWR
ncbi:MAG: sugar transferase [Lachnospiraceae bacterium]|nr:sugar transferase [Lachnospiraceae bacterium]